MYSLNSTRSILSRALVVLIMLVFTSTAQGQQSTEYPYGCEQESERYEIWMSTVPLRCTSSAYARVTFNGDAFFGSATFESDAFFRGATFESDAFFGSTTFDSSATFWGATFNSDADFVGATFGSLAHFRGATFESDAFFGSTTFDSLAHFRGATFNSLASFVGATFGSLAHFRGATFESDAFFVGATFDSDADFRGATFDSDADFRGATLPDTLNFSFVTEIASEIDFTYAQLDSDRKAEDPSYRSLIALEASDISKIKINIELFELWFPRLEDEPEKVIDIYEDVLKKFDEDGLRNSYEVLDIEYQSYINQYKGRVFVDFFSKYWWNYGYNREWVIWWSLVWLGLFTLVNLPIFGILMERVYTIRLLEVSNVVPQLNFMKQHRSMQIPIRIVNKGFRGVEHFINTLLYTGMVFFGLRLDLDKFKKPQNLKEYVLMVYLIGIYCAGLFCVGYIVNIIFIA